MMPFATSSDAQTGARPRGPIRLLTHLRYFGHNFNPVSFYYVYDVSALASKPSLPK